MKHVLSRVGVVATAALIGLSAGCEWTGGGGVEQFNSRYNFLNFSGLYRGLNAGLLITDYSSEVTALGTAGTPGSTNNIAGETIGTGNGLNTAFAGTVDHAPVLGASLSISAGGYSFTDADGDGSLEGTDGATGTFTYGTGQFQLQFPAALANGVKIIASYNYAIAGEEGSDDSGTGSGPKGNATSGTTKYPIYSFNVEHAGNTLRITDNNGALYEGNIGDIRSAGGVSQDNAQQNGGVVIPSAGDEFIAQFSAEGRSKAGYTVRMVGTFQAVVAASSTSGGGDSGSAVTLQSAVLEQRQMLGTWIEEGGRTGNIRGQASPITVTP